jgi:hypothetical protein
MDSSKCQTATASPAEPGELPIGLNLVGVVLADPVLDVFADFHR